MAIVKKNTFHDRRPELRHPVCQPRRHTPAVQGEIGISGPFHTFILVHGGGKGVCPVRWTDLRKPELSRNNNAFSDCIEHDLCRVVKIELLHQIGTVSIYCVRTQIQ